MECKYSYSVELKHANKIFRDTVRIFKDAVSFCILAFESEWLNLKNLNANNKINYADHLIHTTAKNMAKVPDLVKRTLCTYKTYLDILSLNASC